MRLFIKNILIFLLPIGILAYPLDLIISKHLKKSNAYYGEFEVWNDLYNGHIKAELLIHGSSRAFVNFDAQLLEDQLAINTYNLGINGHNFWLQYLRHLEYLKHNDPPKFIILAVDINSLQKRDDLYLYQQFLPYMLCNQNISTFTRSYKGFDGLDYTLPLLRYTGERSAMKEAFSHLGVDKSSNIKYRTKGFKGVNKSWSSALTKAQEQMESYNVAIHEPSVKLLHNFLNDCKEADIKVIMVYTPEYIEGQNFISNRIDVLSILKQSASTHDMVWLDYSKSEICKDTSYFYNATHLNKQGAHIFTQQLAKDLEFIFNDPLRTY